MKEVKDIKPNNAPIYAGIYADLAKLFQQYGYALAIHGSLARDFDLVAVPWVNVYAKPEIVIKAITEKYALKQIGEPEIKSPIRLVYTLSISYGECFIDLSFVGVLGK